MYSHIVSFPLPVCLMGQVSSSQRSLFMYGCSVRRTVSPACLSKLWHMDVIFLIPKLFHWFLGSHNVRATCPSHHVCQMLYQNGFSSARQAMQEDIQEQKMRTQNLFFPVEKGINSSKLQREIIRKNKATNSKWRVFSSTVHSCGAGSKCWAWKSSPCKTESSETRSDGLNRKLLYLQPILWVVRTSHWLWDLFP